VGIVDVSDDLQQIQYFYTENMITVRSVKEFNYFFTLVV
jgi:hypothetical protein